MRQRPHVHKIGNVEFNPVEAKKMKKEDFIKTFGKRLEDAEAAYQEIQDWKAPKK